MLFPYFKIHIGKSIEPWNFGPPYLCAYCGSILWYQERTIKSKRPRNPKFSPYCKVSVRDILNILAQCNKPKPIPACTSNLGFNRLYILMLGFIVTQVIVLNSYIIKM